MWTKAHRVGQARQEQRSRRYPTDLTDTEWIVIEPLTPRSAKQGAAARRSARGAQRDPLSGAHGLWLAHAAQGLSSLADRLLVVPALGTPSAVPHHP